MSITVQQLLQILPNAGPVAGVFTPLLNTAMVRYQIVGPTRIAAFIAQIGHESGQLRYVKEIWVQPKRRFDTRDGRIWATTSRATVLSIAAEA